MWRKGDGFRSKGVNIGGEKGVNSGGEKGINSGGEIEVNSGAEKSRNALKILAKDPAAV